MFEQEYRELMEEVNPDDALVEQTVERYYETKRVFVMPRALKVAAVVFCVLIALAGGTVAVDAATNGSVCQVTYEQIAALCGEDVSTWGSTMQCESDTAWEVTSVAVGQSAQ